MHEIHTPKKGALLRRCFSFRKLLSVLLSCAIVVTCVFTGFFAKVEPVKAVGVDTVIELGVIECVMLYFVAYGVVFDNQQDAKAMARQFVADYEDWFTGTAFYNNFKMKWDATRGFFYLTWMITANQAREMKMWLDRVLDAGGNEVSFSIESETGIYEDTNGNLSPFTSAVQYPVILNADLTFNTCIAPQIYFHNTMAGSTYYRILTFTNGTQDIEAKQGIMGEWTLVNHIESLDGVTMQIPAWDTEMRIYYYKGGGGFGTWSYCDYPSWWINHDLCLYSTTYSTEFPIKLVTHSIGGRAGMIDNPADDWYNFDLNGVNTFMKSVSVPLTKFDTAAEAEGHDTVVIGGATWGVVDDTAAIIDMPAEAVRDVPIADDMTIAIPIASAIPTAAAIPIVGSTGVTADNSKWPELKLAILTRFPFCLPWDLYGLLNVFNAPMESPHFRILIPLGDFYTIDYVADFADLPGMSSLGSLCRWTVGISFMLALVFVTRSLIRS